MAKIETTKQTIGEHEMAFIFCPLLPESKPDVKKSKTAKTPTWAKGGHLCVERSRVDGISSEQKKAPTGIGQDKVRRFVPALSLFRVALAIYCRLLCQIGRAHV